MNKRVHARFPCRIEARIRLPRGVQPIPARIINIGVGGALLRVRSGLTAPQFRLEVPDGPQVVSIEARIARFIGPDPEDAAYSLYGVTFQTREFGESGFRLLLDRVRRGPPEGP